MKSKRLKKAVLKVVRVVAILGSVFVLLAGLAVFLEIPDPYPYNLYRPPRYGEYMLAFGIALLGLLGFLGFGPASPWAARIVRGILGVFPRWEGIVCRRTIAKLALVVLAGAFVYFVYPTPYRYLPGSYRGYPARMNRFTGTVQVYFQDRWASLDTPQR